MDHGGQSKRRPGRPRGDKTEAVFLDAAEQIFAERGYDGTGVRAIADLAGAQLGALHYYFGSKEALFRAVVERRLRPALDERLTRLERCRPASGKRPDLDAILHAFMDPVVRLSQANSLFDALMLRTLTDPAPTVQDIFRHLFDESSFLFVRLLRSATPDLSDDDFYWRLPTMFGAIQYLLTKRDNLVRLSHGRFMPDDLPRGSEETIAALSRMLLAPPITGGAVAPGRAAPARRVAPDVAL